MYKGDQAASFRTLQMTVVTASVVCAEKLQEFSMLTFAPLSKAVLF